MRGAIDTGVAQGHFTVHRPSVVALTVLSLGIDVARWYREDGPWTPDGIGKEYGNLALRMVGWAGPYESGQELQE